MRKPFYGSREQKALLNCSPVVISGLSLRFNVMIDEVLSLRFNDHRSRYLFVATAGLLGSHQAEEISFIVVEKYFSSLGSINLLAADYFLGLILFRSLTKREIGGVALGSV
ncbi:hypothetical protein J1N35_023218 [Gossypium stocksii]|uniref:Uncharacterized protein n=1 Tax=Gossypium stocksii TaxID=47602 RepID=A0A9D3VJN4_9ROSI|nr:hypothetical protein J1N35_023218 [Gossypium stocksii]